MRKFLLMALAGAAIALAVPQFAFAMPAGQHLAHGMHAPGRVGLDARDLRHALFKLRRLRILPRGRVAPRARRMPQHERDRAEQREDDAAERRQRFAGAYRKPADREEHLGHVCLVRDSPVQGTDGEQKSARSVTKVDFAFTPGSAPPVPP